MQMQNLFPTPRFLELQDEWIDFSACTPAPVEGNIPAKAQARLRRMCGSGAKGSSPVSLRADSGLREEGYTLEIRREGVALAAAGEAGFLYGLDRIEQLLTAGKLRCATIRDFPALQTRGFHVNFDGLRHMGLGESLQVINAMRRWNLNTMLVEYASRFPYRRHPRIPTTDALTREDLGILTAHAAEAGIEVIPLQQCLGHVGHVLKHKEYACLREEQKKLQQWCPLHEGSLDLFRELVDDMIATHPQSKMVHLGGDETRQLGECPRCAEFASKRGKGALYLQFIARAARYIIDMGLTPIVWDDMLCHYPDIIDELPREMIIMYWEYWTTRHPSAVFVARPDGGRGVVCDSRWNSEWSSEPEEVERRMLDFFATPIDFERDLSQGFRERFGPYLGDDFPKRVRAFPYLEFYRDKGFRVIGCGTGGGNLSMWHGMPDFPRYMNNIATWSRRAAEAGTPGVITSAWYDFPAESLIPGIMCTGQTSWNPV